MLLDDTDFKKPDYACALDAKDLFEHLEEILEAHFVLNESSFTKAPFRPHFSMM